MRNVVSIKCISLFFGLFLFSHPVLSDQVTLDDAIVEGSICVGVDCANGEAFSFDTLRLKENNLRINFLDTSGSASFPSNDWRIIINDSSNGGENYFAIEDSSAGVVPFKVNAGALANAVILDSTGMKVTGDVLVTGNLELGSSRHLKSNIRALETEEAVNAFKALRPVKYHYKSHPDEDTMGFIAEDVPELVATNGRKSIIQSEIIAVLTKVMQKQEKTIEALSKRIAALEK